MTLSGLVVLRQAHRVVLAAALTGAIAFALSPPASAQNYPNRLIKLVVPFVAGAPIDIVARLIADKLSVSLKQPFVIENRPGAGGNIGTEVVVRAAPDGYTLGIVLGTTLTANPSLYRKLPFDPDKDVRPISIVTTSGSMLVVHPSIPVNSVTEFVAFAKAAAARKEPVAYASGGNGTPGHMVMEKFRVHAGFEAIHVPYRGNTPMVVDLVTGQVRVGFVTSSSPLAPDIPTIAESGYPGFRAETITVLLAPVGLPESITALLEGEVQAALKQPDIIERLRVMDTSPTGAIGAEVRERLAADREAWAKVVASANMRLD
jgi:tripartite-type tricarboxylate transporter receptor subunit TctC